MKRLILVAVLVMLVAAPFPAQINTGGGGGGSGTVTSGTGGWAAYYPSSGSAVSDQSAATNVNLAPFTVAQGTLVGASSPFATHTVTWNNAATIFQDDQRSLTCTAAAALSTPFDIQVGGFDLMKLYFNTAGCAAPRLSFATGANPNVVLGLSTTPFLNLNNAGTYTFTS